MYVEGLYMVEIWLQECVLVEISMTTPQTMENLEIGKLANQKSLLCCVCYSSYPAKKTPEFCWVTARGYV